MIIHLLQRTPVSIWLSKSQILTKLLRPPFRLNGRNLLVESGTKEAELVKDVILYKHENPRFHLYIGFFGVLQFTFWNVMGMNMLAMKEVPMETNPATPWWRRINLGDTATKRVMATASFLIGSVTLALTWFFTIRSVRYLVLRKNRTTVSVVTYTPFLRNRFLEVPLNHISCQGSRTDSSYMPLKIKQRFFMFVVDLRDGTSNFPNPRLFDQTVGMHRKL